MIGIMITSLEWFRRKKFEFFFYSHFAFVLFYLLGAFHSPKFVPFAIAAAAFYAFDRLLRFISIHSIPNYQSFLQFHEIDRAGISVIFLVTC